MASGLLALVVAAAFAVLLASVSKERSSTDLARHSERVLAAAQRLERLVLDLETGQRGFSITAERRFLEPWEAARRALPPADERLLVLTRVRSYHSAAQQIVDAIHSYLDDYSIPLVRRARSGSAGRRDALRSAAEGKRRIDALRARFDDFIAAEQAFVAGREARAVGEANTAKAGVTVGLAGSIVLIFLFGGYLTRAIVVPVRRAAAMAGRLAGGDLSTRMPETGAGEIGALERAFNSMGRSLEASETGVRLLVEEQAALRRVATLVARGVPAGELLGAVVAEVDRVLGASSTRLARYEPDGTVVIAVSSRPGGPLPAGARWPADGDHVAGMVYRTGRTARRDSIDHVTGDLGAQLRQMDVRSAIGAPIVVDGALWGVIVAYWSGHDPPPDVEARLTQFTDLVATAIANADSRASLMASRARAVATADETRRRIERDLHDGAQQRLVHTVITLKLAQRALGDRDRPAAELVAEALDHAERATEALRELVHGILPAALSRGGLRAGVDALAARAPLPVSVDVTGERLSPPLEATGYFIVSEALTNIAKHADASEAEVTAFVDQRGLHVQVRDDGSGGARIDESSGLVGLYDRAAALDGELTVESPPGEGTVVAATLPIDGR